MPTGATSPCSPVAPSGATRLEVDAIGMGEPVEPGAHDLYYVGGGQDREQALVARDLAGKDGLVAAVEVGAALLAVCGGYQLLGRFYRERSGAELPGVGLFPLHTLAGERRMIGDVLLECELSAGRTRTLAGFENHAGRTILDSDAEPLGRVVAGFGNDGERVRGLPRRACDRDVPARAPPPRNPWLADWLLGEAIAHRTGGEAPDFESLDDELEDRGSHRLGRAGEVPRRSVWVSAPSLLPAASLFAGGARVAHESAPKSCRSQRPARAPRGGPR